jgi:integrase
MTPHQSNRRGSLILDRVFKGVGRVRRAAGTKNPKLFEKFDAMLSTLYEGGRRDVLISIRDGRLSILEVWEQFRLGHWDEIPTREHLEPLQRTFEAWTDEYDCSDKHRKSLKDSCNYLVGAAPKNARVVDLPEAVRAFRKQTVDRARTFNLARSAAQAFLRSTLGRHSRLWQEVATIQTRKVVAKFHKNPQTVAGALAIRDQLEPNAAAIWWTLCTTGMRPAELWGEWSVEGDRIKIIAAKKRERVVRFVPLLVTPTAPTMMPSGFDSALGRLGVKVAPYDGRRSYANWLEAAGIPRTRRKLYLGHGQTDVTDLYEWHEVKAFVVDDRAKLQAHIGREQRKALQVMK